MTKTLVVNKGTLRKASSALCGVIAAAAVNTPTPALAQWTDSVVDLSKLEISYMPLAYHVMKKPAWDRPGMSQGPLNDDLRGLGFWYEESPDLSMGFMHYNNSFRNPVNAFGARWTPIGVNVFGVDVKAGLTGGIDLSRGYKKYAPFNGLLLAAPTFTVKFESGVSLNVMGVPCIGDRQPCHVAATADVTVPIYKITSSLSNLIPR